MTIRKAQTAASPSESAHTGQTAGHDHGAALYRRVRAGLVLQGRTLEGLADTLQVDRSNLAKAIRGHWRGPRADALRTAACRAAGIQEPR